MKKVALKILILCMAICSALCVFTACDGSTGSVEFKVNFIVDGEVYATVNTEGNETIKLPKNPTKDEYVFDGWFWDDGIWNKPFTANSLLNAPLSSDMNVYAKWTTDSQQILEESDDVVVKFFVDNEILYTYNLTQGDIIDDLPIVPVKTGYTGSWSVNQIDNVQSSLNVYAMYSAKQYVATLNYNGATGNENITSIELIYDKEIGSIPTPVKDGYDFGGWYYKEQKVTPATIWKTDTDENIEIEAVWIGVDDGHAIISADGFDIQDLVLTKNEFVSNDTESYDLRGKFIVSNGATWRAFTAASCAQPTELTNRIAVLNSGWNNVYILVENLTTFEQSIYTLKIYRDAVREYTLLSNDTYAVTKCDDCEEIIIPEFYNNKAVTEIGENGFSNLSVKIISIGSNVASIGKSAFYNCNSLQYNRYENGLYLGNEINPYIVLVQAKSRDITSCTINEKSKLIYNSAFYNCNGLTSVTIPDSVTSIGDQAFQECYSLASVTIGNSVTSIGDQAFQYCNRLASVTIGNSVTSIGYHAFASCGIETARIPSIACSYIKNASLKTVKITGGESIGDSVFSGCSSLISITIPNSVKSIGNSAFADCSGLTSINIPNSVISIGEYAFGNCRKLTSLTIGNSVNSIRNSAFSGCSGLTNIKIPSSVISIENSAFYKCSSLTSITIPNSVTSIGQQSFSGCSSLTSITIPNSITSIEQQTFSGCSSLTSIDIPSNVKNIEDRAFSGCSTLTSINIPNNVKSIKQQVFSDCSSLTSINIPNSVMSIETSAFAGCSGLTSINIPENVTSIKGGAFSGCSALTSIDIPSSVISIETSSLFRGCNSLISITIPDCVTSIGDQAFFDCSSLTSINIPDDVTSIGWYAFYNCSSLTNINIPDGVTSIGSKAFYNCSGLTSITVASGNIKYHSNGNCLIETASRILILGCKNSVIPSGGSVIGIGDYAFYGCSGLTSIIIPDSVTSIGNYTFYGCSGLTSIIIPDSVKRIGDYAFYGCSGLTSATFKNTNGWKVTQQYNLSGPFSLSSDNLANYFTAATYLKSTYYFYHWNRT